MLMLRRHKKLLLDKRYFKLSMRTHQKKFKKKKLSVSEQLEKYKSNPIYEGNIPYSRLIHSQGENCVLRFEFSGIPKLYACPIFFSAKLYNDHAMVTIKERDKKLLIEALKLKDEAIIERHTKRYLPDVKYDEMKKRAKFLGVEVEFLVIAEKDIDKLTKEKDRYVAFPPENGKIKLAFLPQNKDYVLHSLYPDKLQAESDDLFSVTRNSKVNTKLKSEALLNGKQMRYRTLTRFEVEELHKQIGGQEMFAVFSKGENGQDEPYVDFSQGFHAPAGTLEYKSYERLCARLQPQILETFKKMRQEDKTSTIANIMSIPEVEAYKDILNTQNRRIGKNGQPILSDAEAFVLREKRKRQQFAEKHRDLLVPHNNDYAQSFGEENRQHILENQAEISQRRLNQMQDRANLESGADVIEIMRRKLYAHDGD